MRGSGPRHRLGQVSSPYAWKPWSRRPAPALTAEEALQHKESPFVRDARRQLSTFGSKTDMHSVYTLADQLEAAERQRPPVRSTQRMDEREAEAARAQLEKVLSQSRNTPLKADIEQCAKLGFEELDVVFVFRRRLASSSSAIATPIAAEGF